MGKWMVAHIISVYAYSASIKNYTAVSAGGLEGNKHVARGNQAGERSVSAQVRNPLLKLKAATKLKSLPPEVRAALRSVLLELRAEAHAKAEASWKAKNGADRGLLPRRRGLRGPHRTAAARREAPRAAVNAPGAAS